MAKLAREVNDRGFLVNERGDLSFFFATVKYSKHVLSIQGVRPILSGEKSIITGNVSAKICILG